MFLMYNRSWQIFSISYKIVNVLGLKYLCSNHSIYTLAWLWSSKTLLVNIVGRVSSLPQVCPPSMLSITFNLYVLNCEKGVGLKSYSPTWDSVYLSGFIYSCSTRKERETQTVCKLTDISQRETSQKCWSVGCHRRKEKVLIKCCKVEKIIGELKEFIGHPWPI